MATSTINYSLMEFQIFSEVINSNLEFLVQICREHMTKFETITYLIMTLHSNVFPSFSPILISHGY